jgi:predicted CoA-binding protein
MNEPETIRSMLAGSKTIAVIGLSADPAKPSHYVSAYMQSAAASAPGPGRPQANRRDRID